MSFLKSLDMHFLCMECLGFFDPFVDGGEDGRHEKDYCGNLLINSQGELVNEDDVVSDSSFAGEVLEVGMYCWNPSPVFPLGWQMIFWMSLDRSRWAVALVSKE